jgi:putative SOS response-associated peptidase YedK
LTGPPEALASLIDFQQPLPLWQPRYNIAPTQTAPVVRAASLTKNHHANDERSGDQHRSREHAARELVQLRWGLVPSWATDLSIGSRMINARSETVADKPAFRAAVRKRRCLVPASGFYEWQKASDGAKQPYFIHRRDGQPLAFAGLWESWNDPQRNERIETFTILTTQAVSPPRQRPHLHVPATHARVEAELTVARCGGLAPLRHQLR